MDQKSSIRTIFEFVNRCHPCSSVGSVSVLEIYSFLPVMVSEVRTIREAGAQGRVEPSRECLLDHAAPGSSPETASLLRQIASKVKMHGRELLEAAWQRTNFRDASTLRLSRKRNSRAAQHDKSEIFRQTETLPIRGEIYSLCGCENRSRSRSSMRRMAPSRW